MGQSKWLIATQKKRKKNMGSTPASNELKLE
jgi:hypothetical protein